MQTVRRQQQLEAAERRRVENETRGIKDPEKVRRMQQKAEETARREEEAARMGGGQSALRVSSKLSMLCYVDANGCSFLCSGRKTNGFLSD